MMKTKEKIKQEIGKAIDWLDELYLKCTPCFYGGMLLILIFLFIIF